MFSSVRSAGDNTTAAVIDHKFLSRWVLGIGYTTIENIIKKFDGCIPSESYKNIPYTIVDQEMTLEDQIDSIDNLASFKDVIEKIQKKVPEQKELYNENLQKYGDIGF